MLNDVETVARMLAVTLAPLGDSLRRSMDQVAALGLGGVQINAAAPGLRPRDMNASARRDLQATLRRRELVISGLDLWIPMSHFEDPAHVDRAASAVLDAIDLAGDVGRVPVSTSLPRDASSGSIRALVGERAALRGVVVSDHQVLTGTDDDDAPAFGWDETIGFGLDPAAWMGQGGDPIAAVMQWRPVTMRLVDLLRSGLRGPVGDEREGQLDLRGLAVAVSMIERDIPCVIDARQWTDVVGGIQSSIHAWASVAQPGL